MKPPKGKNYYLSMRNKNKLWLQYKMAEMHTYYQGKDVQQYGNTYRANSVCSPNLTELHEEIYEGNTRQIQMELLDSLRDIALAIWFLDGGNKTGRDRKNAYLNTTKFGENGTKTILRYFNEIDIPCRINHDGDRLKVLFSVEGTETFFKIIAHRFPTFMYSSTFGCFIDL